MRLIDVDKAMKQLDPNTWQGEMLITILKGIPTAYDVDKVVEQLSNKMFSAECYNDDFNGCEIGNLLCMGDVYEIVKGAVKE